VKQVCDGCRALDGYGTKLRCTLGFQVEAVPGSHYTMAYLCRPTTECPKPRTYKALQQEIYKRAQEDK
jgi:hypothetical protein